jgi:hypothetical protein
MFDHLMKTHDCCSLVPVFLGFSIDSDRCWRTTVFNAEEVLWNVRFAAHFEPFLSTGMVYLSFKLAIAHVTAFTPDMIRTLSTPFADDCGCSSRSLLMRAMHCSRAGLRCSRSREPMLIELLALCWCCWCYWCCMWRSKSTWTIVIFQGWSIGVN